LLSIIIPVFNEADNLATITERLRALTIGREMIFVDDCSTDGSREILQQMEKEGRAGERFLYHDVNQGKGAALRYGFAEAKGDIIGIQDADLEYNPQELEQLALAVEQGEADVIYGSRFKGNVAESMSDLHYWGNRFVTLTTNILYGTRLTDMETCYKVWKAPIIKKMTIRSCRFEFEPEVTAKTLKAGYKILEKPITFNGRKHGQGKKISWRDGFPAIWALVKYRFID
jgi:glycosyltransferase involved in cell wall biosynthesis